MLKHDHITPTSIIDRETKTKPHRTISSWLIGHPLSTADAPHQTIGKAIGLAVFASDALSSTAYATGSGVVAIANNGVWYLLRYRCYCHLTGHRHHRMKRQSMPTRAEVALTLSHGILAITRTAAGAALLTITYADRYHFISIAQIVPPIRPFPIRVLSAGSRCCSLC